MTEHSKINCGSQPVGRNAVCAECIKPCRPSINVGLIHSF